MPVSSKHPLYEAHAAHWQRCRDCYRGEDAVKARGVGYLPKPGGLTNDQYDAYKVRALFYEALGRTIDGFVGSISRKDATIEAPASMEPFILDATADGMSLAELIKAMCNETILQGRGGVLVDYDEVLARPYLAIYKAENITNWDRDTVILNETVYENDPEDKFKKLAIEQYRELSIVEGVYTVTLWRKPKGARPIEDEWVIHGTPITPKFRGTGFNEIPFFWLTPLGNTTRIDSPPLLGLVNVCLSHYRTSADLEHGRHFSGLPTLVVTGSSEGDSPIQVGSLAAIVLSDSAAQVYYAEVKGDFTSLENALRDKQDMMATLGAAVFHDTPKGVEAAETARIRTSGETSLLVGVTTAVETTLQAALECAAKWMGAAGKIEVTLNRDYVDTKLDGPTLTALVLGYQAGAISLPQFLYNLQQGELLQPDTDIEEEVALTEAANKKREEATAALAVKTKAPAK